VNTVTDLPVPMRAEYSISWSFKVNILFVSSIAQPLGLAM
jgi:hypothetical protein